MVGGDHDHGPLDPVRDHIPRGERGAEEGPLEIGIHHAVEKLFVGLQKREDHGDAGVADHDVHAAQLFLKLPEHASDLLHRGDVSLDQDGLSSHVFDFAGKLFGRSGRAVVVDRHVVTAARVFQGDPVSDDAAGACHKYVRHVVFLSLRRSGPQLFIFLFKRARAHSIVLPLSFSRSFTGSRTKKEVAMLLISLMELGLLISLPW